MSNLKQLRGRHGFDSIEELAQAADVSWDTVRRIEEGDEDNPKYKTLEAIADALGHNITPDDIMQ